MAISAGNVIARKTRKAMAAPAAQAPEAAPGPEKSWRMALARSARDQLRLTLQVPRCSLDRISLAEVLELAPERGLIAVLEGPAQALGVIMIGSEVLAGLIEAMTTGVVTAKAAPERRPTRTDAAMAAALIDASLAELERGLTEPGLADWAKGFRYASFLEEIRPLGLLLEEGAFNVLRAEVSLALGAKNGPIFMALPAGPVRAVLAGGGTAAAEAIAFSRDLAEQVMGADCQLDSVLALLPMTLAQVMDLEAGQTLALGSASLERITLAGMDGRRLWEGRLGQSGGRRAVRLTEEAGMVAQTLAPATAPAPAPSRVPDGALDFPEPVPMSEFDLLATSTG